MRLGVPPTAADLEALFPRAVRAGVADPAAAAVLTDEEAACIAEARPRRRAEYASGRAAARAALARLGLENVSIPSRPDRSPAWPPGYVGSLSHCEGFCGAVAARAREVEGIGFDAELAEPLAPELAALVCGMQDSPWSWPAPAGCQAELWPTLVFSAKEAVYKCQHPIAAAPLDFIDVAIRFDAAPGGFRVAFRSDAPAALLQREFRGAWRVVGRWVLTGAWTTPLPPKN